MSVSDLRKEYTKSHLLESDVASDPLVQFREWFDEAVNRDLPEPNAMTLATASAEGRPSARIVLLKGFDERGFVFYTNYDSRKGEELAANPFASLVFFYPSLERQIRVEGTVERVSAEESDAYFLSRPPGSRLGAVASHQSREVANREILEHRLAELEKRFGEQAIPRPENWGGFRVNASQIEFWQGRPNRLHDRLVYSKNSTGGWQIHRLEP